MKTLVKLAIASATVLAATAANAQLYPGPRGPGHGPVVVQRPIFAPMPRIPVWTPAFPYAARYHDVCHRKAWRLRWFERQAAADGYFSRSERAELDALRRDLRRTCGDWRWRG